MPKVFIIHGAYGHPGENWFPWLRDELEKMGLEVIVPAFPTPENQSLGNWAAVFEEYLDAINEDTIFVGHSLGPAFILSILEKINVQVKACFFVAGFVGLLDDDLDKINHTFTDRNFDWPKIKQNCGKFVVINSDNDPYISMEKAEELAECLDAKVEWVKGAGHFNAKAGYLRFDELLERVKKEL
jgi:predicted alpha/beta hydrolase family esterase